MVNGPNAFDGYCGKRVLITGHTGFKGAWLALWLKQLGADVIGFALPPEVGRPSLFSDAGIADGMNSVMGDLRDLDAVTKVFDLARPEIVSLGRPIPGPVLLSGACRNLRHQHHGYRSRAGGLPPGTGPKSGRHDNKRQVLPKQ
jgi:hypothetical protein